MDYIIKQLQLRMSRLFQTPGKSRLFQREKPSAFSLKQQKIGSAISSGLTGVVGYSGRENREQTRGTSSISNSNDYRSLAGTNYAQTDNVAVSGIDIYINDAMRNSSVLINMINIIKFQFDSPGKYCWNNYREYCQVTVTTQLAYQTK